MPPSDAWQHLGSGGASEAYQARDGSGQYLVVKVSRNHAFTQQTLFGEQVRYQELGAGCLAIPRLVAIAFAGAGAAADSTPADGVATGAAADGAAADAAADGAAADGAAADGAAADVALTRLPGWLPLPSGM